MLRLLLKAIRPFDQRRLFISRRISNRYQEIYKSILKYLLKTYDYYVINDSIVINNGVVKIVNECRDLYFEEELRRNGIEMTTYEQKVCIPIKWHKEGHSYLKSIFRFKNILRVYIDERELYVRDDGEYTITADVNTEIKCLMRDSLVKSVDVNSRSKKPISFSSNKSSSQAASMFEEESHVESIRETNTAFKNAHQPIRKKGFDIDTTF